jgi:hypothetical protein
MGALHVRPRGEGHGCPESKKGPKKRHPREPTLRVRSLTRENPFAIKLAAFHTAQTEIAFHGFSLHSLTGFRGG